MRPDFSDLKINSKKTNSDTESNQNDWINSEDIPLKKHFTKDDIEDAEHLQFAAGFPPFTRGIHSTMYVTNPWMINQKERPSFIENESPYYKNNITTDKEYVYINYDVATLQGYDSDNPIISDSVGQAGIAIDSIIDMEILLDKIPLDKISISMPTTGAILPIIAFYIAVAKKQGIALDKLSGTIQNNLLKDFLVENNNLYPPTPSKRIIDDILDYTSKHLPKFSKIHINGNQLQKIGATPDIEIAYTLANGIEHIRTALKSGLKIDEIAPKLSFSLDVGMNHFMDIAKMRAARMLWAKIIKQFNPKNPESMAMIIHSQSSIRSHGKKYDLNNITRTCIESMTSVLGGTQSLNTSKEFSLPTDFSSRITRNTQTFIQEETNITKAVDPWAGSYYIEYLTLEIAKKAWKIIKEIDELGGMTKAIEIGIAKQLIKETPPKKDASLDFEKKLNLRNQNIDNTKIRNSQIERLTKLKADRNSDIVKTKLDTLSKCAETGEGNLLELAVEAAENFATLGEISDALEKHFGRY